MAKLENTTPKTWVYSRYTYIYYGLYPPENPPLENHGTSHGCSAARPE